MFANIQIFLRCYYKTDYFSHALCNVHYNSTACCLFVSFIQRHTEHFIQNAGEQKKSVKFMDRQEGAENKNGKMPQKTF